MLYRDLLRLEGVCSIILGAAFAALAFPGWLVSYPAAWAGVLFVPAVVVALGAFAVLRRGAAATHPGQWLTARPLATVRPGRTALPRRPLVRRLILETAMWIALAAGWIVLARSSGLLFFGTGLASVAFGVLQAVASARQVRAVESERGDVYAVAARPGVGAPELTLAAGGRSL